MPDRGRRLALAAAAVALAVGGAPSGGGAASVDTGFRVVDVDASGDGAHPLNRPVTVRFTKRVVPESVGSHTVYARPGPSYTTTAEGTLETGRVKVGRKRTKVLPTRVVTLYPKLPVLPDLSDAGFAPGTTHRLTVRGGSAPPTVRRSRREALSATATVEFKTADGAPGRPLFDPGDYGDPPPPRVAETSPPDVLPVSPWDGPGGGPAVPASTPVEVRFNRVPLHPATLQGDAVTLTMIARRGERERSEIPGRAVLEQDHDSVTVRFEPDVHLPDDATFALRLGPGIADLTGEHELPPHAERAALNARALSGAEPALAALRAAYPEAVHPRTFLVFSTLPAEVAEDALVLEFDGTDRDHDGGPGVDERWSTASFHDAVPGATAGQVVPGGGDGSLGDFIPDDDVVLDSGKPPARDGAFHFQGIHIRQGITVRVRGPLPARILAVRDVLIEGRLDAGGEDGELSVAFDGVTGKPMVGPDYHELGYAALPLRRGGAAGAGGGPGGDSSTDPALGLRGGSGGGVPGGAGGGEGGDEPPDDGKHCFPGGGGGGGHRSAGTAGLPAVWPGSTSNTANGSGGAGGAASPVDVPFSTETDDGRDAAAWAGAGGGAGGNGRWGSSDTALYRASGAGGGGGGGVVAVAAGGSVRVSGSVVAWGGFGGGTWAIYGGVAPSGAPGGGGAGGSVLLYAAEALDVAGGRFDVRGATGGLPSGYEGLGGAGRGGWICLEDRDGEIAGLPSGVFQPDAWLGTFDPRFREGDAYPVHLGNWIGVGAMDPAFVRPSDGDFAETVPAGCAIRYEIQAARPAAGNPHRADVTALNAAGDTADPARASPWLLLRDTRAGSEDLTEALNGKGFRFVRLRITFLLNDGRRRSEQPPAVHSVRLPFRYGG